MKYLRTLALAVVLLELALPAHLPAAEVTPATDETTISTQKPALGYPSKKLLPSQHQPTTTVYPAGTTSSARGGDTVSLTSTDFCTSGANAIVCTGTDSKVSSTVLPTSVMTGTGTTNFLPRRKSDGSYQDSSGKDDGNSFDVGRTLRATGATAPLAGSGLEMQYVSGNTYIFSINRDSGSLLPMQLYLQTLDFYAGGTGSDSKVITITAGGLEGQLRATKSFTPTSGASLELQYNNGGILFAYDRTNSVYKPLSLYGSSLKIGRAHV